MKNITIYGRLTKDGELKTTPSGDKVLEMSVAVDHFGKEKSTLYFDCSFWGKRGEAIAQYMTKGSGHTIAGDFFTSVTENGKTFLKINVTSVSLGSNGGRRDDAEPRQTTSKANNHIPATTYDDEIPF